MRTFNKVFFVAAAILMLFVPTDDKDAISFAIDRVIGFGVLWLMYQHVEGKQDEADAKDEEIRKLKAEQEELLRRIAELEDEKAFYDNV